MKTKILSENQWSETITNSEIKRRFFKVGDSYKKSTTLQKMASEKRELGDIMNCHACDYNCRYDHEEAETISSSTYRWKCDKHFPVCLFGSYKDDMMHTSHFMFGVSRFSTLYKLNMIHTSHFMFGVSRLSTLYRLDIIHTSHFMFGVSRLELNSKMRLKKLLYFSFPPHRVDVFSPVRDAELLSRGKT